MLDRYRRQTQQTKAIASQLMAEYNAGAGLRRGTDDAESPTSYARRRLDDYPDVDHADVLYHVRAAVV